MSRPRQPAFQFYTGDWLKDPELSACTPATRGIWADCVARMWEAGRSGKLAGSYEQLARLCRCTAEEMRDSVDELRTTKTATVTIRNGRVTLTNRRMWREHKARKQNALRQKRFRDKRPSNAEVTSPSSKDSKESTDSVSEQPLFPPLLDTLKFRTVWVEWLAYRREIKKTVKPITQKKQLKKLATYGEARAIERLERSMANGWTGFDFEPDKRGSAAKGRGREPVGTDDERREQIAKLD